MECFQGLRDKGPWRRQGRGRGHWPSQEQTRAPTPPPSLRAGAGWRGGGTRDTARPQTRPEILRFIHPPVEISQNVDFQTNPLSTGKCCISKKNGGTKPHPRGAGARNGKISMFFCESQKNARASLKLRCCTADFF